jgi:predicted ABC-type ATPase
VHEFVNADAIAIGLSAFRPATAAVAAGRVMLRRLDELAAARVDFAFESTLAARSFAPWLRARRSDGYRVHIVFLALPDADTAVLRVADRVRSGGHAVPEMVIRRRFEAGLRNFHGLYRGTADGWRMVDTTAADGPVLIAEQVGDAPVAILDRERWVRLERER